MASSLKEQVKKYILEHELISRGDGVVVGVSGGPDSLCLAHILMELRQSLSFEICLAHLNHSLRGEESEEDMDFVSRLSREWDVTVIFETVDVYEYIFKKNLNLEEAARDLRYSFFERAAYQFETGKVALGHTADDQVETILMHLLRGSGIRGISGMSPSSERAGSQRVISIIRPLLSAWRRQTEEYCRQKGLEPRFDSSNLDRAFLRNRLRLDLIPHLVNINPAAKEAILRFANIASESSGFLESEVEKLSKDIIVKSGPSLYLKSDRVSSLHPALQQLLLQKALCEIYGSARDLEAQHVETLRSALDSKAGTSIELPGGVLFLRDYGGGWLCHNEEDICPFPPLNQETDFPEEGQLNLGAWLIKSKKISPEGAKQFLADSTGTSFQNKDLDISAFDRSKSLSFSAAISLDRIKGKLHLRNWRYGDRFQPLGMESPKKLQDFMTDEKIPRWWRKHIPLICAGEDILWVPGWRISELARVREGDENTIYLEIIKL